MEDLKKIKILFFTKDFKSLSTNFSDYNFLISQLNETFNVSEYYSVKFENVNNEKLEINLIEQKNLFDFNFIIIESKLLSLISEQKYKISFDILNKYQENGGIIIFLCNEAQFIRNSDEKNLNEYIDYLNKSGLPTPIFPTSINDFPNGFPDKAHFYNDVIYGIENNSKKIKINISNDYLDLLTPFNKKIFENVKILTVDNSFQLNHSISTNDVILFGNPQKTKMITGSDYFWNGELLHCFGVYKLNKNGIGILISGYLGNDKYSSDDDSIKFFKNIIIQFYKFQIERNIINLIPVENKMFTKFKFIKQIGAGGYADVWEAIDKLERTVAVKIVRSSSVFVSNQDVTNPVSKLVLNHAKMLALVNHPNVVTVHDIAKVMDPKPENNNKIVDAIVMEYLNGITLHERLKRVLNIDEARLIGNSIIDGLEAIHNKNITHNDFHTENIIISTDKVKIIDLFYDESTFAILTTMTKEHKVNRDIRSLKENLIDIIDNTPEIPYEKIKIFINKSRYEKNIYKIKESFNECLSLIVLNEKNESKSNKFLDNKNITFDELDRLKKLDLKTYIRLKEILPYEKSIRFIKEHDFSSSFNLKDLNDLNVFSFECEKPEFEFLDKELEEIKFALNISIKKFTDLLEGNIFPIGTSERYRIPPEWKKEQPEVLKTILSSLRLENIKISKKLI